MQLAYEMGCWRKLITQFLLRTPTAVSTIYEADKSNQL